MELVGDVCGKAGRTLRYEAVGNPCVRISIYSAKNGTAAIDSEYATTEPITIHEELASLIVNENSLQIIMENHTNGLLIRVSGEHITTEELFCIAENLKISQK